MTQDMRRGAAPAGDAPSTISPQQATSALEDSAATDLDNVLDAVFAGASRRREQPTLFGVEDLSGGDVGLFYPGRVNWLAGPMGSGKSWIGSAAVAIVLLEGGCAGYLDCESDAATIVGRLRDLGVDRDSIAERFRYHRPHGRLEWHRAVGALLREGGDPDDALFDLIAVDGVTASFVLTGANPNDAAEVREWVEKGPAHLARATGAGVVCIDHLGRAGGDTPAGSFHKLDTVDGVAYALTPELRPAIGKRGVLALRNIKDRPGTIDTIAARGSVYARVVLDDTGDGPLEWYAAQDATRRPSATETTAPAAPRVTAPAERREDLLEAVSRALEAAPEPLTGNAVKKAVTGAGANVLRALEVLVDEGHVVRETTPPRGAGKHPTHRHRLVTPYPSRSSASVSSPPLRGVGGRTTQAAPTAQTQGQTQADTPQTQQTQAASSVQTQGQTQQTHPHRQTHPLAVVR